MKKLLGLFILSIFLLMTFEVVFAESTDFIKKDLEEKGKSINSIMRVNVNNLPEEIIVGGEISNFEVYKIDVGESKPLFAITYSQEENQIDQTKQFFSKTRQLLNFGFFGEKINSGFLKTSLGIESGLNKGYTMIRKGSITGISTNLEILQEDKNGFIEIVIYKNGEEVGFRNVINSLSKGVEIDFDAQSQGIVNFEPGDVISVYVFIEGNIIIKDISTLLEITN